MVGEDLNFDEAFDGENLNGEVFDFVGDLDGDEEELLTLISNSHVTKPYTLEQKILGMTNASHTIKSLGPNLSQVWCSFRFIRKIPCTLVRSSQIQCTLKGKDNVNVQTVSLTCSLNDVLC